MVWFLTGHSDPEKLKSTAQDVQGMTAQQLEKRQAELKVIWLFTDVAFLISMHMMRPAFIKSLNLFMG